MSSLSGIQGLPLEVTVVGCLNLKDKEWISRQDPYVCVEYASTRFRTRTCTDGGKNPTFQEKFAFNLIEGLREINVVVWNSNTLSADDLIGSGRVQLQKVLSQGFDDSSWTVMDRSGKYSGEVRLILHYSYANQSGKVKVSPYGMAPTAPYALPTMPGNYPYAPPPPTYNNNYHATNSAYPPQGTYPPMQSTYPPPPAGYPPTYNSPSVPSYPYPPPPSCYPPGPPSGIYPPPPPY